MPLTMPKMSDSAKITFGICLSVLIIVLIIILMIVVVPKLNSGASKNSFSSPVKFGEYMNPHIPPYSWGNGAWAALMNGAGLSEGIYNGYSWNPPNIPGCDCNNANASYIAYTASTLDPNAPQDIPVLTPGKANAASDQAAFYADMLGPEFGGELGNVASTAALENDLFGGNNYGFNGL